MAAVLAPLGLAVHLAQFYPAAHHPGLLLEVHPVQARFSEDHLVQGQHLGVWELVDPLVNQVLEVHLVSALFSMDQ